MAARWSLLTVLRPMLVTSGPGGVDLNDAPPPPASVRCLHEYVAAHNELVESGRPARLADALTGDAALVFAGDGPDPFLGRREILRAFAEQPPTDALAEIEILSADDASALASYSWRRELARGGRLWASCRDGRVSLLVVLPSR